MAITNALSILLIVLTLVSYLPQYYRLLAVRSSVGISITATFLITLVTQAQAATMYYLFESAPFMRYGVPIATPPSTRDWLNLTQILVQWCCSLVYFALIVTLPAATTNNDPTSVAANTRTSKATTTAFLVLHALLFLVSRDTIDGRPDDNIGFTIVRNINAGIVNPLLTICAATAYILQARTTRRAPRGSDTLSKLSLMLQIICFLLLAISWPFRLILPENMWGQGDWQAVLISWYPWVGWACVNSAVFAAGQAVVLYVAWKGHSGDAPLTGEQQHLLAT